MAIILRTPGRVAILAAVEVVIPFTLIAAGEITVDSSTTGVLIATEPMFVLLWNRFVAEGSWPSTAVLAGVLLGFVGVAVLLGAPDSGVGAALILVAAACYGLGAVLVGSWFPATPSLPLSAAMLTVATPALILAAAATNVRPSFTTSAVAATAVLGAGCTAVGFASFFALIRESGAQGATLITYAAPIVALAAGVWVRDEAMTWRSVLGAVLVLAGAWVVVRRSATQVSEKALRAPDGP